ncbi:UDP-N-acetylglucosamine:LPS N-acetylglucosamine transferase [Caldisphaera lagunensis DSM 15908]|uniref:UDP-N-acetylglucosamine:LPS N-acetylglucosamine transferase n=1 Tax=Caldisphaera lagunensis (strain DSM 15908 / JCM 11604 / ANMR 0165 / IC-154) TaxID=1056495 RepID=L0AA87_CALLD|nr:UDP-N-acetylglucosamine--LPS N-acetylglucosamine transferase [Caldisphaera lagunensis]AFZ70339.1 UDP-N-acetylglucosamine:LPS N-acetylglucosamine transferase [Caldisphaera lagunensis DSM 15908]
MKKVLIIASGGGHTGHSIALAEYLIDMGIEVDFIIPENDTWTRNSVINYGNVVSETPKFLDPSESLYKGILRAPIAIIKSLAKVKSGYKLVIASGSNHSISTGLALWLKGSDIIVFESTERFLEPSRTIKTLGKISKLIAFQWEEQLKFNDKKGKVVGPFLGKLKYNIKDEGYILVSAGSYGYKKLFDALSKTNLENIVLQTGKVDPKPYIASHPEWKVFQFDPNLEKYIASASIVITHFGRTAVESALKYKKPTILAPNIEWKWMQNEIRIKESEIMAKKLNAYYLPPNSLNENSIMEAIKYTKNLIPYSYNDGALELAKIVNSIL